MLKVISDNLGLFSTIYMMSCISICLIWCHDISHSHILGHEVSQPYVHDVDTAAVGEEEEAGFLKEMEASLKAGSHCSGHLEAVATL